MRARRCHVSGRCPPGMNFVLSSLAETFRRRYTNIHASTVDRNSGENLTKTTLTNAFVRSFVFSSTFDS